MDAYFSAELNERLFTHFTGGVWRAPQSQRLLAVHRPDGRRMGQIACANTRDLARALAGLQRAGPPPAADALLAALQAQGAGIARLRAEEGFAEDCIVDDGVADAGPGAMHPMDLDLDLAGPGPLVLMTSASFPLARLAPILIAGAGPGMIWKPAPLAAASAHLLMRVLGPLAAGRLAMVQGDHETGAGLAHLGPLVWASDAPPPPGLPAPVLRLAATAQARP